MINMSLKDREQSGVYRSLWQIKNRKIRISTIKLINHLKIKHIELNEDFIKFTTKIQAFNSQIEASGLQQIYTVQYMHMIIHAYIHTYMHQ